MKLPKEKLQFAMKNHIQNSFSLPLLFLFFSSIFLSTSCKQYKEEQAKVENICTLTAEQVPEVRGFRLGMTLEQILNKYPRICKMPQQIPQFDINIKFFVTQSNVNQAKKEEVLENCSGYNSVQLNVSEHPEFSGVEGVDLKIIKNSLSAIEIKYSSTSDETFVKEFPNKIKDSLGLSAWTNWTSKQEDKGGFDVSKSQKVQRNELLCNKIIIGTSVEKYETRTLIKDSNGKPTDVDFKGIYYPALSVQATDQMAMTDLQKKQVEEQKRLEKLNAEKLKSAEDKKKAETFKP